VHRARDNAIGTGLTRPRAVWWVPLAVLEAILIADSSVTLSSLANANFGAEVMSGFWGTRPGPIWSDYIWRPNTATRGPKLVPAVPAARTLHKAARKSHLLPTIAANTTRMACTRGRTDGRRSTVRPQSVHRARTSPVAAVDAAPSSNGAAFKPTTPRKRRWQQHPAVWCAGPLEHCHAAIHPARK
jgi:hypothetical protein